MFFYFYIANIRKYFVIKKIINKNKAELMGSALFYILYGD